MLAERILSRRSQDGGIRTSAEMVERRSIRNSGGTTLSDQPSSFQTIAMPTILGVILFGGLGAAARYGLERWLGREGAVFPWWTFTANVTGSFLLGVLFAVATERVELSEWLRTSLAIGLLGGYTTFSTFSLQTHQLLDDGAYGLAVAYVIGSVALGLGAATLGIVVVRAT